MITLLFSIYAVSANIIWNDNIGTSCDFVNNDLFNARTSKDECFQKCNQTSGCTHFTWSNWNSGTCWMKKGYVEKDDAFANADVDMICGIVRGSDYTQTNVTTDIPMMKLPTVIVMATNQTQILSISSFLLFFAFLFIILNKSYSS